MILRLIQIFIKSFAGNIPEDNELQEKTKN